MYQSPRGRFRRASAHDFDCRTALRPAIDFPGGTMRVARCIQLSALLAGVFLEVGCRRDGNTATPSSLASSTSSAASVEGAATASATATASAESPAVVSTSGALTDVHYPVLIPIDASMQAAIDNAAAVSASLDAQCASIPMSAALASQRPGGTGCPRDLSAQPAATSLAQ
jgi:hypothetical protein